MSGRRVVDRGGPVTRSLQQNGEEQVPAASRRKHQYSEHQTDRVLSRRYNDTLDLNSSLDCDLYEMSYDDVSSRQRISAV